MEVLGIDVGGSGIKGAPVDIKTGEFLSERFRIPTPNPATPDAMARVIGEIIKHFNWNGNVGIGFPAAVQNGEVLTASNIDDSWIGIEIESFLSEKTGCNVYVANDADVAGIAEMKFGGGKGHKGKVLLLTLGTGIGTVFFVNGLLFPNTELGHLEFLGTTIEEYASDATRKREDLSWKKWGRRLNKILNYYEQMFYPDLIIIGGGISKKMDKFQEFIDLKTELIPATFLNSAGIIGAAVYGADNHK